MEEKLKNEYKKYLITGEITKNARLSRLDSIEMNRIMELEAELGLTTINLVRGSQIFQQALSEAEEIMNSPLYKIMNEVENE